mmetsp:Transcript_104283/g.185367  ORF Transcript_104283/g.185367 Transcript_104283/m.185367 type:complete len:234 (+) Transcript_104283:69-770(+)
MGQVAFRGSAIVTVSTLDGEVAFSGEQSRAATVLSLKKEIQKSAGGTVDGMKLVWNGTVLQPNHAELGALVGECQEVDALLVKLAARRVWFDGIAWKGYGAPEVTAGVSAKHASEGQQLTNKADKDAFVRHLVDDGVKFESVTHPGLFLCAVNTVVLGQGDGKQEIFREIPALNGAPEPCMTLESLAKPESFLVHCNGKLYCHSLEMRYQQDLTVFNNDASWRLHDCEEDEKE